MKMFFSVLRGHSLIINLAQLVSPSVALPAELVLFFLLKATKSDGAFMSFYTILGIN